MSSPVPDPFAILESPFAGDVKANKSYARRALRDAIITRKVNPYASHLLLTQALDDEDFLERIMGIKLGTDMYRFATKCLVYADRGISRGMEKGIAIAQSHGIPVTMIYLDGPENHEDVFLVKPTHLILS